MVAAAAVSFLPVLARVFRVPLFSITKIFAPMIFMLVAAVTVATLTELMLCFMAAAAVLLLIPPVQAGDQFGAAAAAAVQTAVELVE
jgi:hypothetical protein